MMSRKARALVIAGVAAGVVATGVTAASASGVWTVKGSHTFTASSGQVTFKSSAGTTTCASSKASGTAAIGKHSRGTGLLTISGSSAKFAQCKLSGVFPLTTTGFGTWKLNAASYSGGVTKGKLAGVSSTVKVAAVGCSFNVTGAVPFSYSNKTHVLNISGPGLKVSNVKGGCPGVSNGQGVSIHQALKLSKPITISH